MTTQPPSTYIDTMIFVYSSFPRGELSRKSKAFLQDIENGRFKGIVATYTIMEYLAVIKQILFSRGRQLTPEDVETELQDLEQLINDLGIALFNTDDLVIDQFGNSTLFSEAEEWIKKTPCSWGTRRREAHALNGADALSLALATRTGATFYATFDEDFLNITNGIQPLMIWDEY